MELEAENVADGGAVGGVGAQQRHEETVLVRTALEALQDDVQHTVWIQVESTCIAYVNMLRAKPV